MELFCAVFPSGDLALSIAAFGWSIDGFTGLFVPGLLENHHPMATPRNTKRGAEGVHRGVEGFEYAREVRAHEGDTGDGSHDGSLPARSKTEMRSAPG